MVYVVIPKKSPRTPSLTMEIEQHIARGKLGNREVDTAIIKPVPKTGETWHSNANDWEEHLTVEFKRNGEHVTTHHVRRSNR
ncbi:hypothetical protein L207DRAFT_589009 [Hyaloscypha variabilis F]|uniref:Uncharacterized protein n=1 Tax=Hyaloscypha variabilis (strain UAMH 11265 / GT02V1 / F) TaxID=1149755 RepID=A0A2J6R7D7_HYAVF|nr:hypothetical protein L207DRAFT_589009 [Hyaloscypha variabilis F]